MEIFSPTVIKELLEKYHAKPLKGLGQNFLIDKNALEKIITAADVKPTDIIIEVGPGIGTLTQALAQKAKKVIAIEKDAAMVAIAKENLKEYDNVEIINTDALKSTGYGLPVTGYKVVANIPYYITSPIIRMFLEAINPPGAMVLMVQKEVAQRICAKPGDMSILAVSVQCYAKPEIISYVKKGCFWPVPNVDSAILKITPHAAKMPVIPEAFFKVVKAGFLHPRKKLINNLSEGLMMKKDKTSTWLFDNHIEASRRAETLTIAEWQALTISFSEA